MSHSNYRDLSSHLFSVDFFLDFLGGFLTLFSKLYSALILLTFKLRPAARRVCPSFYFHAQTHAS